MAQVCGECGTTNPESDKFCRNCGEPLLGSVGSVKAGASHAEAGGVRPLVAVILIGALLLCCLGIIGVALLDELVSTHPLRTLVVGTPTLTSTWTPSPTFTPTATPIAAPTTPTVRLDGDSFEPDNTIPQAREIAADGDPQTHTLSPPGDRDFVSFWATEGMQYTTETGNLGDQCDTVLTLYDEEGTELASDDDGADEALASRLTWVADEDGTLFVEIAHFSEGPEPGDTSYDVWVTAGEPLAFQEDEYEPDDTMTQAREILLDVPRTHTIHVQGDHDWVYFQAEEGITYVVETSDLGSDMDTVIYLYDEDGEQLAEDDDGGEESLASRITWSADSSGVFYVMIRHYSDDSAAPSTHYSISVSEGAPFEADAYEPDDSRDQASEIEVGSFQSHNLHVIGDEDWVSFLTTAGTNYVIETFNLGDSIDTIISLSDADGQELASDDDGGGDEPLASRLTWTAAEDAVLYVMIQDLGDDDAGPGTEYRVSVREEGRTLLFADEYEPDDTVAEASEIEAGETQNHNIHAEGDHDWLSFEGAEGTTYLIETSNLGQEMDTIVFLYDQSGTEVAQDDDGSEEPRASRIAWTADDTATFHILVRDYKDNRAGRGMEYDISLREIEPVSGETRLSIAAGAYHITAHEVNEFIVGISDRLLLENFTVQADAAQVSGNDDNEYGLVFGYQDQDNYYEVAISGDGHAGFFAKEGGDWHTIVRFRPHEPINEGNAVNHLRLEVDEGRFSFYINDELAFEDFDDRFRNGFIGFGCGPLAEPGLHCSFDNLIVRDEDGDLVWQDDFDDNSGSWSETPQR